VRTQIVESPSVQQDRLRLADILATRRAKSQEFFTSTAGHWSQLRRDLFGTQFELAALPALLNPEWIVGDLGCGTGQTAAAIAPFVHRVLAVDESEAMLQAAQQQLETLGNIELRHGRLEVLPLEDESLDAAILMLVLHHLPEPQRAIDEVGRVLKPGGSCLIVDMLPHDREDYRQEMGHLWLGFSEARIDSCFRSAGIQDDVFRALPTDPSAKGPALFAASGRKSHGPKIIKSHLDKTISPETTRSS
jgi:ArsR family transcriptional regulator